MHACDLVNMSFKLELICTIGMKSKRWPKSVVDYFKNYGTGNPGHKTISLLQCFVAWAISIKFLM